MRVRRRFKLVEALQFDGSLDSAHRLAAFTDAVVSRDGVLMLTTARGLLTIVRGDWVVRDPETADVGLVTNGQFFRDHDHLVGAGDVA